MSETPRTDAQTRGSQSVSVNYARQLERELDSANAQLVARDAEEMDAAELRALAFRQMDSMVEKLRNDLAARDAEIERLREALREWIAAKDAFDNLDPMDWVSSSAEGDRLLSAEEAIRAALAQAKEPT